MARGSSLLRQLTLSIQKLYRNDVFSSSSSSSQRNFYTLSSYNKSSQFISTFVKSTSSLSPFPPPPSAFRESFPLPSSSSSSPLSPSPSSSPSPSPSQLTSSSPSLSFDSNLKPLSYQISSSPSQIPPDSGRKGSKGALTFLVAGAFQVCAFSTLIMAGAEAKEKIKVPLPPEVVLYQYEACPFCNKVKAYLDYRDIGYRVVEVNPLNKKELKWSNYKKVPVLVVDGEQFNDSTAIITTLETRFNSKSLPSAGDQESEESKWRRWVDEHLVHMLSPNIYRSPQEAMEAFEYITTNGQFSGLERMMAKYAGATAMYFISKRLKKKYKIEDPRASLYEAVEEWVGALNGRDFLGGDKPNLADVSVFGVLRPIRNLRTGEDMMLHTNIGAWYKRMEGEVGGSNRLD